MKNSNKQRKYIIGIAGHKECGKDTVADMLDYFFKYGSNHAQYGQWLNLYNHRKQLIDMTKYTNVIHYSDNLKKILSTLYGIPLICFYDRDYKDNKYYSLKDDRFYDDTNLPNECNIVTKEMLDKYDLAYYYMTLLNPVITLRLLMQYFGTNICREHMQSNIWITSTIAKALNIAKDHTHCIIADVRFDNELEAIKRIEDNHICKHTIYVQRPISNNDTHYSENALKLSTDFVIDNNESLEGLFNKTKDVYEQLLFLYINHLQSL